jgi:hypothetical protein
MNDGVFAISLDALPLKIAHLFSLFYHPYLPAPRSAILSTMLYPHCKV